MTNNPTASLTVDYPPVANRDDMMDALGRNDWFRCVGLHIFTMERQRRVQLQAVNSRNVLGRCVIEVPMDPAVLKKIADKLLAIAAECEP